MHNIIRRTLGALLLTLAATVAVPTIAAAQTTQPWNSVGGAILYYDTLHEPPETGEVHELSSDTSSLGDFDTNTRIGDAEWNAAEAAIEWWESNVGPITEDTYSIGSSLTQPNGTSADVGSTIAYPRWDTWVYIYAYDDTGGGYYCEFNYDVYLYRAPGFGTWSHVVNPVQAPSACDSYTPKPYGVAWDRPAPTRQPPSAAAHKFDVCAGIPGTCATTPVGKISLSGGVDKLVLDQIGIPHWNANEPEAYNGQIGSTKTTGTPGNWDVFVNVYNTDHGSLDFEYRCEYHATVTGTEAAPVVTQVGSPVCSYYNTVLPQ
jgi:hypothetical protein